jgi:hypothetical protein
MRTIIYGAPRTQLASFRLSAFAEVDDAGNDKPSARI